MHPINFEIGIFLLTNLSSAKVFLLLLLLWFAIIYLFIYFWPLWKLQFCGICIFTIVVFSDESSIDFVETAGHHCYRSFLISLFCYRILVKKCLWNKWIENKMVEWLGFLLCEKDGAFMIFPHFSIIQYSYVTYRQVDLWELFHHFKPGRWNSISSA